MRSQSKTPSTSRKKTRASLPGSLDKTGNPHYTPNMTNTKNDKRVQQLKHPDAALWRQVKAAAILSQKTMTEWVEDAIRNQLAENKKAK